MGGTEFQRQLLASLQKFRDGDFGCLLDAKQDGIDGEIAAVFNEIVTASQTVTSDFERFRTDGSQQEGGAAPRLPVVNGPYRQLAESFNNLMEEVLVPTDEVVRILDAVALGDLSQNIRPRQAGRPPSAQHMRVARAVERVTGAVGRFSTELTHVIREIAIEGRSGSEHAVVEGLSGSWKGLLEYAHSMAADLAAQVLAFHCSNHIVEEMAR
jgi:hypothetical protein